MAGNRPRVIGHDPVEEFEAADEYGRVYRVVALRERLAFADGDTTPARAGRHSYRTSDGVPVHAAPDDDGFLVGRSGVRIRRR